jgi:hypothetical protein
MQRHVKKLLLVGLLFVVVLIGFLTVRRYDSLDDSLRSTLPKGTNVDRVATENHANQVSKFLEPGAFVLVKWVSFEPEIVGGSWDATVEGSGDPLKVLSEVVRHFGATPGGLGESLIGSDLFKYRVEEPIEGQVKVTITGPSFQSK